MSARPEGTILLVESDPRLGQGIAEQLLADGYCVELACNAAHARVLANRSSPTLAVLGLLDSPRGALGLLEEIRQAESRETPWDRALPAIVLGSNARELDMLRAFEAGADDFLPRTARYLELRARLRAILRRSGEEQAHGAMLEVGSLAIDLRARSVCVAGRAVALRPMEFELLAHLARDARRVFPKDELLRAVWGYRADAATRTVDTHASRLRRKLDLDGSKRWVVNVWGVGYRLL
ncbi:MAG TPA: response regulator transcription factor [Solirubrobacteraceae bacterium]|nr:response regulator transcription factor [Solirubrobacteraceae bacterium]